MDNIITEILTLIWSAWLGLTFYEQVFSFVLFGLAILTYYFFKNGTKNLEVIIEYGRLWQACLPDGISQEEADQIKEATQPVIDIFTTLYKDITKGGAWGVFKIAFKILFTNWKKRNGLNIAINEYNTVMDEYMLEDE